MADNKLSTPTKTNGKAMPEPSPQEARFFFSIIKNMNNKPEIDWEAVAQESGFKNGKVAITRFSQVKKKLGFDDYRKSPTRAGVSVAGPIKANNTKVTKAKTNNGTTKEVHSGPRDDDFGDLAVPWKQDPGTEDEIKPALSTGLNRSQPIHIDDDDVTVDGDTDTKPAPPGIKSETYPPGTV